MSVTIDGVKGYEYQYKVTVLISLLPNIEKVELFVEAKGSEDALLKIKQQHIDKIIEIQVKRENNNLDILKLVDWLCHFQEKKSDNNLLQRIADNKDVLALFVTHSRCSDDTLNLKTEIQNISAHEKISISKNWKDSFTTSLTNISFGKSTGKSDLMQNREQFCQKQSRNIKSAIALSKILQQVLIWEEFSDEKVDNQIVQILNTKYNIAQSKTQDVYLNLLEVVKKGRDIGNNILEEIKQILQKNRIGRPQIETNYKSREEEVVLSKYLVANNFLLLSGISQCGKSEIAKRVSIHFIDKGYDFFRTDNTEEIQRFLSSNILDNKIAILEDPWGHTVSSSNYLESKRKIEDLILNIQSHHKLIITSRLEILFEIFNTSQLNDCKLKGIAWCDLTVNNHTIINEYWQEIAKRQVLSEDVIESVSSIILSSNENHLPQIGQLHYLAFVESDILISKSSSELEHIARSDSEEIARSVKLKDDYYGEVLAVLAMCATPIQSVRYKDITYILSVNKEKVSITNKKNFFTAFSKEKDPSFPKYPQDITMSNEAYKAIEYLAERQIIRDSNKEIVFTHPNYYEAGRFLFFSQSKSKQKRLLKYFFKCIACLNPINSYIASKQLSFIYNGITTTLKVKVIKQAFKGLNSIFPSVEDSSMIFLINIIEAISQKRTQKLIGKIQDGGVDSSHIYWHKNKIPFISNHGGFGNLFMKIDPNLVSEVETDLISKRRPDIFKAWTYINNIKRNDPIPIENFKILLQYNEGFIRKKVAIQVFNRLNEENKEIALEIFNDEHPSVVFNAIRASFFNWFNYTSELKTFVFDLIKNALNTRHIAIRTYNLISTFSVDYGGESIFEWKDFNNEQKKELWNIWGELYPITMRNLPLDVFTNTARFGATMDDAIKYLEVSVGIKVLEAWIERIEHQIQKGRILDEFEMAVADNLMQLTESDYETRKVLFSRLISYDDTSFILSNLKWIIEYWSILDGSEKDQIEILIQEDRKDLRWIKAVLLNSYSPPDRICFLILGEEGLFSKEVEYILTKFPEQLLKDCLNVYCGSPQPLWWLAVHHKNKVFWGKVIRYILMNEFHVGFDICLEEFLGDGVNGFSNDWKDWESLWKIICTQTNDKSLLTESLIYNTASCTCNLTVTNKLWTILIESYISINCESTIISLIADNIELLQQSGHKEDLLEIFDSTFILKKIIPKLTIDSLLINLLDTFRNNSYIQYEDKVKLIAHIIEITKGENIRFFGTFNFIESLETEENIPEEIKTALRKLPHMIDDVGKRKLKEIKLKYNYKLEDWIGIN